MPTPIPVPVSFDYHAIYPALDPSIREDGFAVLKVEAALIIVQCFEPASAFKPEFFPSFLNPDKALTLIRT